MPLEVGAASLAGPRKLPGSKLVLGRLGDERLADQLRRGNEVAFEVIYDRHHRSLLSFCTHLLGSREAGEEAVQQTFLSSYKAVVADAKRPEKLKSWLFAIARNRCLSILRARKDEHPLEDEPAGARSATPELQAEQRAETRELLADLRELPEEQRAALVLTQVGDLSHAEVADVLDCPAPKVKSLVFQARSALVERRAARELPCDEVREEIASLRRLPRRGRMRRHVRMCPGCAAFAEDMGRQRKVLALALPVTPSVGLKRSVLAATGGIGGGGAGGGGLAAGTAAKLATTSGTTGGVASVGGAGGGLMTAFAGGGAVKLVTATLAAGSITAGAVTAGHSESSGRSDEQQRAAAARDQAAAERAPAEPGPSRDETRSDRPAQGQGRGSKRSGEPGADGRRAHGQPSGNPAAGPPGSPPGADRGGGKAPAHASRPAHAGSGGQPSGGGGPRNGGEDGGSGGGGRGGGGPSGSPNLEVPVREPRVPKPPKVPRSGVDDALRDAPRLP